MSSLMLTSEIRREINKYIPQAQPELEKCIGEDEAQQVIETHISRTLDAPGDITRKKVQSLQKIVDFFYPQKFLESTLNDISSIFTQIHQLNAALDLMESEGIEFPTLEGITNPLLILDPNNEKQSAPLGVFKKINKKNSNEIIREKVSYLVDKVNVPPTFIINSFELGRGSFQMYINGSRTINAVRSRLSRVSFFSSHIRALAISEIRRVNNDPSIDNMLICSDGQTFKFIDGSLNLPCRMAPHRISCLFINETFRKHLSAPFSQSEITYIRQQIDIDATHALLKQHGIQEEAIRIHRCALSLLKHAVEFNEIAERKMTLEDLLVIVSISDPNGHEFTLPGSSTLRRCYGENTLFNRIIERKDGDALEIYFITLHVFHTILRMKDPQSRRPKSSDEAAVYDYYHDKSKALFFSYLRNANGTDRK